MPVVRYRKLSAVSNVCIYTTYDLPSYYTFYRLNSPIRLTSDKCQQHAEDIAQFLHASQSAEVSLHDQSIKMKRNIKNH